jgi:SNF2 family DNA or RNA helicase
MRDRADLRPYQHRAVEWVKDKPNCALWMRPGYGKTPTAFTAFVDLVARFDVRRTLITAPLRVARKVWPDEHKVWSHLSGATIATITGTVAERMAALRTPADIHTINVENVAWLEAQFIQNKKQIKRWPWDMVIADESQLYKSQSSKRYKSLKRLRPLFPRLVELTGGPTPNGYGDLWSQVFLLDQGKRLGATEEAFLDRWFDAPMREGLAKYTIKGDWAKKEIQALLADIVYVPDVDLGLPPVIYNPIRVTLPDRVMAKYRKFAREYILELKSQKTITAVNAGVLYGKLLQLANGAIYVDDKGNYGLLHNEKIDALLERLEEVKGPCLIAYEFRSDLARITAALERYCGKDKTWMVLRSDASFDAWKVGTTDYGVLHPGSAGHGLNDVYLSGAENLIWFGLTPNYEHYDQLNGRLTGGLRREGRNIVVDHIIADDTLDPETYDLLTAKGADQDDLLRAVAKLAA